jgi:hypothetical protein
MNKTYSMANLLLLFVSVLSFCGCTASARSKMMVDGMKPMMEKMSIATNRNSDVEMVRSAMPATLLQLSGFIEVSPDNTDLLLRAAEANSGYAFLFVEDVDKKRAANLHKKARDYALRVLKQNEEFAKGFNGSNDEFNESLKTFEKEDVKALFFAASSWFSFMSLTWKDDESELIHRPRVLAMLNRIMELDDTFNYGAIHVLLGSYNAVRPSRLGGDIELSKYHYDKAFKISDSKFLLWHLLYAKYYAVRTQDLELFIKTIDKILTAPEDLLPEKTFVNEAVKLKAKILLKKVDLFFDKDGSYLKNRLAL